MFVHKETGAPAFLIAHDGDVTFSDAADLGRPHHTTPGHRFFSDYREATPEEIQESDTTGRRLAAVRDELRTPPKRRATSKAPSARASAKAGRKAAKDAAGTAPKAEGAPAPAAAGDKPPPESAGSGGGEPHGEKGTQTK